MARKQTSGLPYDTGPTETLSWKKRWIVSKEWHINTYTHNTHITTYTNSYMYYVDIGIYKIKVLSTNLKSKKILYGQSESPSLAVKADSSSI